MLATLVARSCNVCVLNQHTELPRNSHWELREGMFFAALADVVGLLRGIPVANNSLFARVVKTWCECIQGMWKKRPRDVFQNWFRSLANVPKRRARFVGGGARFSHLESRMLLSGIVTSTLDNGVLSLHGDAAGNGILVSIDGNRITVSSLDSFESSDLDPTNIVGVASANATELVISLEDGDNFLIIKSNPLNPETMDRVQIDMGASDDHVRVDLLRLSGDLSIDTGDGRDEVVFSDIQVESATINTGGQSDNVDFGALPYIGSQGNEYDPFVVRDTLTIDTGDDRDRVLCYGKVMTGTTLIRTGAGDDEVELTNYGAVWFPGLFGNLRIETGTDRDEVNLSGLQLSSLSIDTASGVDTVRLGFHWGGIQVMGPVNVATGDGNDQLDVGGGAMAVFTPGYLVNEFLDLVTFSLGSGSDLLQVNKTDFSRAASFDLGDGRDIVDLGRLYGGLMLNGPLLVDTGNGNDWITIGIPGVTEAFPPHFMLGTTDFNGPVTFRGGDPNTRIDWYSDNAHFNARLSLSNVQMTEHRIDRRNLLDAPMITVMNGRTATVRESQTQSFITGYKTTRGKGGKVAVKPIITKIQTGISLTAKAVISSDRRYVTIDLQFVKSEIGTIESRTINTPLGEREIELPQILKLEAHTQVIVPDGGTVLAAGLKQTAQWLHDGSRHATSRDLQLLVTPRIMINEEEWSTTRNKDLSVTLELRLLEMLDFNVFDASQWNANQA